MPPASTTVEITLPDGLVTVIDRADQDLAAGWKWRRNPKTGYVWAERGSITIYLHRLIAGAGGVEVVDHANGDPLDNRSANLRIATRSQNGANRGPDRRRYGTTSDYKGVSWSASRRKWCAYVHVNGRTRSLGRFDDEDAAARAYNAAALEAWGEFARLNIIPEGSAPAGDADASRSVPV